MANSHPKLPGKYKILTKIHQGGMGDIYRVQHKLLEVERVIKMIRPQLASEAKFRRRFLEEARGATQLDHPNIAKLYDFSISDDDTTWMVMEYISGVSLQEILQALGPPDLSLTLEIARQCLRALGFLHRKGWIHRDISPDNIMLAEDVDHKPLVKLIDLGIAKKVTGGADLTSADHFFAKMRYSSPEHFSESGAETRSDLYSLGLVLYELLTGKQAISGADPHKLMRAQFEDPPLPFAVSDPQGRVPEDLRYAVLKALAKQPEQRFATAEDFAAAIAGTQAGHPLTALDLPRLAHEVLALQPRKSFSTGETQDHLNRQFGSENTPTRPSTAASDSWRKQPGSGSRSLRMPSPEELYQQTASGRVGGEEAPGDSLSQAAAEDLEDSAQRTVQLSVAELKPPGDVHGTTEIPSLAPPAPPETPNPEPSSPALRDIPPIPPQEEEEEEPTGLDVPISDAPSPRRHEEPTATATATPVGGAPTDDTPAIKLEMPAVPGTEAPQRTRVADSSSTRDLVREARAYAESQGWTRPALSSDTAAGPPPPFSAESPPATDPPPPAEPPPPVDPPPPAEPTTTMPSPQAHPPAVTDTGKESAAIPPRVAFETKTPEAPASATETPTIRSKTPSRYVRVEPVGTSWWVNLSRRFSQLEPLPGRLRATGNAIGSRVGELAAKTRRSTQNFTGSSERAGGEPSAFSRLAPYRLPILGGVAALVVTIVLLLAWRSEPETKTVEVPPPPLPVEAPPPPKPPPPPVVKQPTKLHPQLQEAQRYLAEGDLDLAAEALANIKESAIALFDNEPQIFDDIHRQIEESIAAVGEQQADQIAQMLSALENGSIPQLRTSYDALYGPRLASPEAFLDHWDDFKKADRILKAHKQLQKNKRGTDLLKTAAAAQHLATIFPAYENRGREIDAAVDAAKAQARQEQAAGNLAEAKTLLDTLRSTLTAPPADLGLWIADLEQQLKADDNIRSNIDRATAYRVEGQPEKGLQLLAQLDLPTDHAFNSEVEQLRQGLGEDLLAGDQQPPEIRLDGGDLPTYRRNQSVELTFIVTDDHRVVGIEAWVRLPGDNWQAADLEEDSSDHYKLTITRDHHQNKKKLELYLKAVDVSGNDGTFGTRGDPKTLNRKGRFR